MLYNPNKLFIGKVGNTRRVSESKILFEEYGYSIVKQDNWYDYNYIDILSKNRYTNFHSSMLLTGDNAIFQPVKLTTYIQQIYEQTK